MTLTERQQDLGGYVQDNCLGGNNARLNNRIATDLDYQDIGTAGRGSLRNSRALTADLNALREAGCPICADHRGIFWAEFLEEAGPMLSDYRNRARRFSEQANFLDKAAANLPSREAVAA